MLIVLKRVDHIFRVVVQVQLLYHMIFDQQRGDLAQALDPIVREVENLYALVVH